MPPGRPDGRRVAYYLLNASGGVFIWIAPVAGGPPVSLTNGSDPEVGPEWSSNGEAVAFWKLVGGLVKLTVARLGRMDVWILDGFLPKQSVWDRLLRRQ